jgi:hypothetical protein
MELIGITLAQFETAIANVTASYGGNLEIHDDAKSVSSRSSRGRVVVRDSRGPGARRSWSGRHGKWACWHAYRDVLTELFEINPDARIRTSLTAYIGRDGFESSYPATAYKNIGSMVAPAYMPELCDCDE